MAKRKNNKVASIDPAALDTYFKKRMYETGIADTSDHFFKVEADFPQQGYNQAIFTETPAGDIEIHYPSLYGGAETIPGTEHDFIRLRYKPENAPPPDVNGRVPKYFQQPKSGVHIFHPPGIVKKFQEKIHIETLYVVEGEFKAFAGALMGLDIVGLGGITLFAEKDEKQLHSDLLAIISTCDVTNLVLLFDADVDFLEWDPDLDPAKDLARRLNSFCSAVLRFREMAKGQYKIKDVYYSRIRADYVKETKGLDDLLQAKRLEGADNEAYVVADLQKLAGSKIWFETENISQLTPYKIRGLFFLNPHKGVPSAFYYRYEPIIKDHEFTWMGGRYRRNKNSHELELVKHEDSFKYIRIGCDYFKMIHVPNAKGILQRKLEPWKAGEITRDYVNDGHKNFFSTIARYDAPCNVPCHTADYKAVIDGCFNMYYPLDHELQEGSWPNTEGFLKHIFGEKVLASGHTNYELALDYLTLLYRNPTQRLPIIALVNRKKNTGKSTFLWFLEGMFQNNYTEIGNEELKDHLNDDWAPKLIVAIDEGFIEKKTVLERLKSMSTGHTIKLRGMYAGRKAIPFFAKFVISSNDEDNFAPIDEDETRFWVNKVPVLTKDDPKILEKMREEVPAFLQYLTTREVLHPEAGRHWFSYDLIETDAAKNVKKNSKGWGFNELELILQKKFLDFQYHTLNYSLEELFDLLNKPNAPVKFRLHDIKKQLNDKFHLFAKLKRYEFPLMPELRNDLAGFEKRTGRAYEFRVENFFTEEEIRKELQEYFDYDAIIISRQPTTVPEPASDDLPF